MSSENAHFLAIGNPSSPVGDFYDCFKDPQYKKIHIDAFKTPNFEQLMEEAGGNTERAEKLLRQMTIEETENLPLKYPDLVTPGWVRRRMEKWGLTSPLYQSKVRGNFSQESDDTVIPLLWIEQAEDRYKDEHPEYIDEQVVGV